MTEAEGARALFKQVADRVDERLFGVREPLGLVMVGILTGNHVLIDDVPGVGKTTLVRILSTLLGLRFQRVQFTPDLMPSDITGTSVLNLKTNDFESSAAATPKSKPAWAGGTMSGRWASHRPRGSARYFRCALTSLVISNIETCFLPLNTALSLSSALMLRLFALSCSLFFLM